MDRVPKGYEFFDHTADVGVRATGRTLAELLIHLAQGLTELIAEESLIEPREARSIRLTADDVESLLLVWLQELLFWFSVDRFLPATCEFTDVSETVLRGTVRGERFDPSRHTCGTEVKGITRHQLQVEQRNGRWEAQVIVDV